MEIKTGTTLIDEVKMTASQADSCCGVSPLYQPSVSTTQTEEAAQLFAALADSTRLAILNMLTRADTGEVCVCDITSSFKLGQPTISHHLRILREAGLVRGDKRGKWVYYSLVIGRVEQAQQLFNSLLRVAEPV